MLHGLKRYLPLFAFGHLGLVSLVSLPAAFATTFGPIPVTGQVKNANYIVRGQVIGASWVAEERTSRRPYTYWKLQVIAQPKGESLGGEVTMRQPGGEIGGLGYHVAGSANFRPGEETFVMLRDTDDPGVKEVVGLASGKYTVEAAEGGKKVLMSGLGFPPLDENKQPYTPETFTALVERVVTGRETEKDQNVFLNKTPVHESSRESDAERGAARETEKSTFIPPVRGTPGFAPKGENPPISHAPAVEETPIPAEEQKSSWGWVGLGIFALVAGAVYFRKR